MNTQSAALHLSVQYASAQTASAPSAPAGARLPRRDQIRRWAGASLGAIRARRVTELTLRFVDAREGRRLNRDHRGRDYATNVLTFNLHDEFAGGKARALPVISDIVVCVPVIAREAREQRKTFTAHCAHLIVHGVLHAHGYDHETPEQAAVMEAIEVAVLARFRIADPYGD